MGMKNWLLGFGLVLLLSVNEIGCAGGQDIENVVAIGPLTLSPEGEIEYDKLEEFANRWAEASGTEVAVAPLGTPVRFVEKLDACGYTYTDTHGKVVGIDILTPGDPRCHPLHDLLHEVGHAVCNYGVIGKKVPVCHTADGNSLMFAKDNGVMKIDEESLTEVCSHRDCGLFSPEVQ